MSAEVCLDSGTAANSGAARASVSQFWPSIARLRSNSIAALLDEEEHYARPAGNPKNVG
jgi:hypothetical protein